jgi:hypothetical protein
VPAVKLAPCCFAALGDAGWAVAAAPAAALGRLHHQNLLVLVLLVLQVLLLHCLLSPVAANSAAAAGAARMRPGSCVLRRVPQAVATIWQHTLVHYNVSSMQNGGLARKRSWLSDTVECSWCCCSGTAALVLLMQRTAALVKRYDRLL